MLQYMAQVQVCTSRRKFPKVFLPPSTTSTHRISRPFYANFTKQHPASPPPSHATKSHQIRKEHMRHHRDTRLQNESTDTLLSVICLSYAICTIADHLDWQVPLTWYWFSGTGLARTILRGFSGEKRTCTCYYTKLSCSYCS